MSDIFVSYAAEDRDKARNLAEGLERQGWSVWWDRTIPAGRVFHDVIEEAVEGARCIIVLWSRHSVSSRWVRAEAEEGANRGILVPVLLEQVRVPLAFRSIQAADLTAWDGAASGPFGLLVRDISSILDRSTPLEAGQPNDTGITHGAGDPPRRAAVANGGQADERAASGAASTCAGQAPAGDAGKATRRLPRITVIRPDEFRNRRTDAVVVEQDCDLILETDWMLRGSQASVDRLVEEMDKTRPGRPGALIVQKATPLRFLAVVHDFSVEPSWREEWIAAAFAAVFREAESRRLGSIATPLLGTVHGRLGVQRSAELLNDGLDRTAPVYLIDIVLVVPPNVDPGFLDVLGASGYQVSQE